MRNRCNNPNNRSYPNYGGRGIKICGEWDIFKVFYEWALANGYDESLTLDRKNNSENYSPKNCAWVDRSRQARNKRNTRMVTVFGETLSLHDAFDKYSKVSKSTFLSRIDCLKWDAERALLITSSEIKRIVHHTNHRITGVTMIKPSLEDLKYKYGLN